MLNIHYLRIKYLPTILARLGVVKVTSVIAIFIGSLVILGWYFDIEILKKGFPGSPATMKANTALCFLLSGLSLWLSQIIAARRISLGETETEVNNRNSPRRYFLYLWLARFCAVTVTGIGLLTLIQYLFDWNFGIDELLFPDSPIVVTTSHAGRMGINTATSFTLIGLALYFIVQPKKQLTYWSTQIFALIVAFISLESLLGYAYEQKILYGVTRYTTSMALHTALTLMALSIGILWAGSKHGLMQVITSKSDGGLIARRLLFPAITVPFVVGWLILKGLQGRMYDPVLAISLFATILIIIFSVLIWQMAMVIDRLSRQRKSTQAALKENEEKLQSFVNANIIGILFSNIDGSIYQGNDEFLRIVGYTQEDLLAGRINWWNLTPPEYIDFDEQVIAQAQSSADANCVPFNKEYIRKDGSRVSVLVGFVLLGEEREKAVCFILDLTEQQAALRQLQEAEAAQQKLVSVIENSSDFIGIATLTGQATYINEAGQKLVGLTSMEEVKQKQISDFIISADQAYLQEHILPTAIKVGRWQGEFRFRNFETGQAIPVDYQLFTINDRNTGEPIAFATVTRNITDKKQTEEKILQLNQKLQRKVTELQTLLDMIPIGIGIAKDPECKTINMNPAFAKLLRMQTDQNGSLTAPPEERPTKFKVFHEGKELTETELPMQYSAAHGVEILDFEVDVVYDDGTVMTLLESVTPLFSEDGKTRGCIGAFLDITGRKQSENLLRNHQKWLEDVLNWIPIPVIFLEPVTARVTFSNQAADKLAGGEFPKNKPAEEYHTIYHCTDAAGNRIPNEQMPGVRVARGESLVGVEVDWHTSKGIYSLLIYSDALPAIHGYPITCIMTFQDVTKLKQIQKDLLSGYKNLQLLFNTANSLLSTQQPLALIDSIFQQLAEQIDLDVYFNYAVEGNSQVMRLVSYEGISEELAEKIEMLEFGQGLCGTVAQTLQTIALDHVQESTDPKTEILRSLGIKTFYGYPLIAQGRLIGTLSFGSRSLCKFNETQKSLMQAVCDQIAIAKDRANLIASLQVQTEELRDANRMKDEFLAVLSHELRSPLNAIVGWSHLLQIRKFSEDQMAQGLETIERNAKMQNQLIDDLLDISRITRGKLKFNPRNCDLVPIIKLAIDTVSLAAQAKEINLHFYPYSEESGELGTQTRQLASSVIVSGDSDRLQQIIWNLLINAIKFTPQGGNVEIRLNKTGICSPELKSDHPQLTKYAEIQVIDDGVGITADFLPYVFDRFRQADSSSTRSYGGLGLGLSLVRHLTEMHGGTVDVESLGENQGSTFTVKIPLLEASRNAQEQKFEGETEKSPSVLLGSSACLPILEGVKVLVVDDEADSREFIAMVLKECQAEVTAVTSVPEALQMLIQWQPDVLVSDIGMPGEDGYSLIRKVRSLSPQKGGNIPAAALTAYAGVEDRMRAIQTGFQLYLPKPIEPEELATVVASLVKHNVLSPDL
ncbi:MAG: PAS domain S-box protein [Dolichospermum sp. DET50]|nr:PAS domain S-box protein [Dolichospermum sp. DET66]MBS3031422.1 PAS domain S-box protein [Dolichospermum sp. DET67]MBS3036632.1 PAS domain S-box protein [Dolichospermum sp. DET50]QSX68673.1 MAG: PAS domain S-box protein [Dolichospermum sp. DET69]